MIEMMIGVIRRAGVNHSSVFMVFLWFFLGMYSVVVFMWFPQGVKGGG